MHDTQPPQIISSHGAVFSSGPSATDPVAKRDATVAHIEAMLLSMSAWPAVAVDFALKAIAKGEPGPRSLVTAIVADKSHTLEYVLGGYDEAARAELVNLVMGGSVTAKLTAIASVLAPERAKVGRIHRLCDMIKLLWQMFCSWGRPPAQYVLYVCKQ